MKKVANERIGLTLIEVVTGIGILCLSLVGFLRVVVFADANPEPRQEYLLVQEAARNAILEMQQAEFSSVYALYNEDPFDDPAGIETAPGHRIHVPGLQPAPDGRDGPVGLVIFPTAYDVDAGLELREDVLNPDLGMPRDLNGDSRIDERNHAKDYSLLPVTVRFEWWGQAGHSFLETRVLLADY